MRLGPLEQRVLDVLWRCAGYVRVRDLQSSFPQTAYTTLMTTLDRLHRKGILERVLDGRAFAYRPRLTRAEAVVSFLLEEVGTLDGDALDALERLVQQRRRVLDQETP